MLKLCISLVACVVVFVLTFVIEAKSAECGTHDRVSTFLYNQYGETPKYWGTIGSRGIMEMWSSNTKGTWTIVTTNTQGISCIVTSGRNYDQHSGYVRKPGT